MPLNLNTQALRDLLDAVNNLPEAGGSGEYNVVSILNSDGTQTLKIIRVDGEPINLLTFNTQNGYIDANNAIVSNNTDILFVDAIVLSSGQEIVFSLTKVAYNIGMIVTAGNTVLFRQNFKNANVVSYTAEQYCKVRFWVNLTNTAINADTLIAETNPMAYIP